MDFFRNIGTGELLFLVLLAILLVGPKRAVELMQQAGRLLGRVQKEWRSVQQSVISEVRTLQDETLGSIQPALGKDLQEIAQSVREFQRDVSGTEPSRPTEPAPVPAGEDRAG